MLGRTWLCQQRSYIRLRDSQNAKFRRMYQIGRNKIFFHQLFHRTDTCAFSICLFLYEYNGPYFLLHVVLRFSLVNPPSIEVMLLYYTKWSGHNKFNHTHSKWIDVDCIMFTVTMSYNAINKVYTLDRIDAEEMKKFVTERIVQGSCMRFVVECNKVGVVFLSTKPFKQFDVQTCINYKIYLVRAFQKVHFIINQA